MSKKVILVTGSSSGFGRLISEALARAGHKVYASVREIDGKNAVNAQQIVELSRG